MPDPAPRPAPGPAASVPRSNNLDALRLLFAVEVMLVHLFAYFETGHERLALSYLPGVPAFFLVSGFLIWAAYDHAPSLRAYATNRLLRLYPALVVVALAGTLFAAIVKGDAVAPLAYLGFFLSTVTLGQSLHPEWLRDVGVGVMIGPLWTIATELLFYASVPVLHALQRRWGGTLWVALGASFALYWLGRERLVEPIALGKSAFDFLSLTPAVWGWMFLVGSLLYVHFERVSRWLHLGWLAVPALALVALAGGDGAWLNARGQVLGLVYFVPYAVLILWAAFRLPVWRPRADLSYGVYIWHMIAINALLVLDLPSVPLAIGLTLLAATLSWYLVERPALSLKRASIRREPRPSSARAAPAGPAPAARAPLPSPSPSRHSAR